MLFFPAENRWNYFLDSQHSWKTEWSFCSNSCNFSLLSLAIYLHSKNLTKILPHEWVSSGTRMSSFAWKLCLAKCYFSMVIMHYSMPMVQLVLWSVFWSDFMQNSRNGASRPAKVLTYARFFSKFLQKSEEAGNDAKTSGPLKPSTAFHSENVSHVLFESFLER